MIQSKSVGRNYTTYLRQFKMIVKITKYTIYINIRSTTFILIVS